MPVYVFAISSENDSNFEAPGFDGAKIRRVVFEDLCTWVCDFNGTQIRPQRKHLQVHHTSVDALMAEMTVLPMAFGMIAETDDDVRHFMESSYPALMAQIERLKDAVEIGVKVRVGAPNLFEFMVARSPELQTIRDNLSSRPLSREEQIEVGRMVANAIGHMRELHTQTLEKGLLEVSRDARRLDVRDDHETVNLAFLVPRPEIVNFEQRVEAVARILDDECIVKITGALAPYSFVTMG